ncbi:hypothetical protein ES703_79174 [subsurface metagenome]
MGKGVIDIPGLLEIDEAAAALGVGVATIYRWLKSRKLIPLDIGGRTLIPQSEIERLKNAQAAEPAA